MRDGKVFARYIDILSNDENTFECIEKSLECLWETYHIAKAIIELDVDKTLMASYDFCRKKEFVLPNQKVAEACSFQKEHTTYKGGAIRVSLYKGQDVSEWTQEDKNDLNMICDILFMHFGRYHRGNLVTNSIFSDARTGLPNTQGFIRNVENIIAAQTKQKYNGYCFNLKRFGLINKKYGNNEADLIINRYADALREFIEKDECVGRLGGDYFVALVKRERTQEFLTFLSGVTTYANQGERQVPVTISASIGIYELDKAVDHYDQVISNCAMAMNIAKNVLKKPYLFYSKEMSERVDMEKKIVADFSTALKNNEFDVFYQSKVETDGYEIIGAEALVRWCRDGGLVMPGVFIPIIERHGLVCDLDFYVLERVCLNIREWKKKNLQPTRISVNFSRKHLSNPRLADDIMDVIKKYDVDTRYIEIEVTETVDEEEQGLLSEFMKRMQALHIAVAIDDFGTGYSSLNILRTFPVDVLKIDKSFIDNQQQTENDQVVLSNIIQMAKQLNMDVISEGVETWEQVEFLHDMGCRVVQGFLFDKPMPMKDFEQRLQNRRYDVTQVVDYVE